MTIADRAAAYSRTFPDRPPLQVVREGGADVLYGTWLCGNDYRTRSTYYGAYPHGYLPRVMALFPEFVAPAFPGHVLHLFSGSLPAGNYERCDLRQDAELQCSVYDLPNIVVNYRPRLILADPPYSASDAQQYGTPMVNRGRVFRALR